MSTLSMATTPDVLTASARVCVVSEELNTPLDEGGKKFAHSIIHALADRGPTLGISIDAGPSTAAIQSIKTNKLFISRRVREAIRAFRPDLLCYIPSASDTVFSFMRLRVLASAWPSAKTAMVALQPRAHSRIGRSAISRLAPDAVFVQSVARMSELRQTFARVRRMPSGVNLERFRPVDRDAKQALRVKLGLPTDEFLLLHVGHITERRGVVQLAELQQRWQVVMVTGNSVGQDAKIRHLLEEAGVIVMDRYLDAIEEVYQASDCYVFPVSSNGGSIEAPLSVLEAMACDIPVVTTRFGGLRDMFGDETLAASSGLLLADSASEMPELIAKVAEGGPIATRTFVESFSWAAIAERLIAEGLGIERKS